MIGMHPPKRAIDIAIPWAEAYFDMMPIHEKLRGRDFPTIAELPARSRSANIYDELIKRMDAPAVLKTLDGDNA